MATAPDTEIRIYNVPWDNSYKDVLHFDSIGEQEAFFTSRGRLLEQNTYQRQDMTMKVAIPFDEIIPHNYVSYVNHSHNAANKRYYCFILNKQYVNDNLTILTLEMDVWQSFLFYIRDSIRTSFIIRRHVPKADDILGNYIMPENLETGDYIINQVARAGVCNRMWVLVMTTMDLGYSPITGTMGERIYNGLATYAFSEDNMDALTAFLKGADEAGKSAGIVALYMCPERCVPGGTADGGRIGEVFRSDYETWAFNPNFTLDTLDGYEPKNKKMFTTEFNKLLVSNMVNTNDYAFERFSNPESTTFLLHGTHYPTPAILCVPREYNDASPWSGDEGNIEEMVTLGNFPQASWVSNSYQEWLAQNKTALGVGIAASFVGGIASAVMGNVVGAVGGGLAIASQLAKNYQHSIQPQGANGNSAIGAPMLATDNHDFFFFRKTVRAEYAKQCDDFMTMFGYRIAQLEPVLPHFHSRSNWNYIQLAECNLDVNFPQIYKARVKKMFTDGVTLWHKFPYFLDYSQDNT